MLFKIIIAEIREKADSLFSSLTLPEMQALVVIMESMGRPKVEAPSSSGGVDQVAAPEPAVSTTRDTLTELGNVGNSVITITTSDGKTLDCLDTMVTAAGLTMIFSKEEPNFDLKTHLNDIFTAADCMADFSWKNIDSAGLIVGLDFNQIVALTKAIKKERPNASIGLPDLSLSRTIFYNRTESLKDNWFWTGQIYIEGSGESDYTVHGMIPIEDIVVRASDRFLYRNIVIGNWNDIPPDNRSARGAFILVGSI